MPRIEAGAEEVRGQLRTVRMGALPLGFALNQARHLPAWMSRREYGGPAAPDLDAAGFRDFGVDGWVEVAMEFSLEAVAPDRTVLRTATRVRSTSPSRAFRAYWGAVRVPSALIRREVVRVVARRSVHAGSTR